jgi:hypothetical protein
VLVLHAKLALFTLFLQCDLVHNREVTTEEGRALAKSFGVPFFESSAKSRINVEEPFYELVRQVMFFVARCPYAQPVSRACIADAFCDQVREMRRARERVEEAEKTKVLAAAHEADITKAAVVRSY